MSSMRLVRIAVSSLAVSAALGGCTLASQQQRVSSASGADATLQLAAKLADSAERALTKGDKLRAVADAENAVAASPRDASYRQLLGRAYLAAGRFGSARQTFTDALVLDPENQRAALNLALTQIATGRRGAALQTLEDYKDKLAVTDFGLALALAGDVPSAVRVLETAARTDGADAKTRQNFALALALSGQWQEAKTVASQDLSPELVDGRMAEWAQFARPRVHWDQVASLLNVRPAFDMGQPVRLALAPAQELAPEAVAQAEPAPEAPAEQAPVQLASNETSPIVFETAPAAQPAPVVEPVPVAQPVPAAAPEAAPVIRAPDTPVKQIAVPISQPGRPIATRGVESGKFVVQLGAYENAALSADGWTRLVRKHDMLASYEPANAVIKLQRASFYRLSVGGFESRADAVSVCAAIKAEGGQCFVRTAAGDAPARWVQKGLKGTQFAAR